MYPIQAIGSGLLLIGLGAACGTGTEPSAPSGPVAVTLSRTNITAPATSAPTAANEAQASLDLTNVSSFIIEIVAVHVRRAEPADDGEPPADGDGEWIVLGLDAPVVLDLLALPEEGEEPLVIAAGLLESGNYNGLRLIVGAATVTFLEPFTVGLSTFEGEHAATIPSGAQTGLKAQVGFAVTGNPGDDVGVVGLLFDQGATIGNAVATGSGKVIVTPVLR